MKAPCFSSQTDILKSVLSDLLAGKQNRTAQFLRRDPGEEAS